MSQAGIVVIDCTNYPELFSSNSIFDATGTAGERSTIYHYRIVRRGAYNIFSTCLLIVIGIDSRVDQELPSSRGQNKAQVVPVFMRKVWICRCRE